MKPSSTSLSTRTGAEGADVEMVRGGDREADQLVAIENRHHKRHVGTVASTTVWVVVHDHIAGLDGVAARLDLAQHATDIAGNRPRQQRRRLRRLTQLVALGVDQRRAEILALTDD